MAYLPHCPAEWSILIRFKYSTKFLGTLNKVVKLLYINTHINIHINTHMIGKVLHVLLLTRKYSKLFIFQNALLKQ